MITVAIDFGTSNTVVSFLEPDTQAPKILRFPGISSILRMKNQKGDTWEVPIVPSLVFVQESNQLVVGDKVRSQRLGISQPNRLFKAFKRELAADFQSPPRKIDGINYDAQSIAEAFIQQIWGEIQKQNIQPEQVILTAPVGAFERYLDWFRDVGTRLGVKSLQIVDESTAAALGYAIKRPEAFVLVVDFGGGTLDLSLVRTVKPPQPDFTAQIIQQVLQAQVIAKSDAYVGGEDIDIWIVEDYLREIGSSREKIGQLAWQNLLAIAEKLKISLSSAEEAKESWLDESSFMSHELKLTRDKLEKILENQYLLEHLRNALDELLAIALSKGVAKTNIEKVVLVGGSCMIPCVQQLIFSYFGKQKVSLDKPFEAVAYGALILTQIQEIDDYLHHSYVIRLWEPSIKKYNYNILLKKGTKYPCKMKEPLILQVAKQGQKEIYLDIGELAEKTTGEVNFDAQGRMISSPLTKKKYFRALANNHTDICVAHLTPPGEINKDRVSVEFEVDENRILLVTVWDLETEKLLIERKAIAFL